MTVSSSSYLDFQSQGDLWAASIPGTDKSPAASSVFERQYSKELSTGIVNYHMRKKKIKREKKRKGGIEQVFLG